MGARIGDSVSRIYRVGRTRAIGLASRCLSPELARHHRPEQVVCLLTERCSSKCLHCDIWRNRGVEKGPSAQEWKHLFAELRRWLGPIDLVLTGGEALLKPFTVELVEHASSIGLKVELLTHGYWKDQSILQRLAIARPERITLSLDGLGTTHDKIRGRSGFFDRTNASIKTLIDARATRGLDFHILLKTVIMSHNIRELADVTKYAASRGLRVRYQPIEQNYGEEDDAGWTESSTNWPTNTNEAISALKELVALKQAGYPIENTESDLEGMIEYFREPDRYRIRVQHHDVTATCGMLGSMQIQANGDIKPCFAAPPIGNFREGNIRIIWLNRPRLWESGCCMQRRMSAAERADVAK